MSDVAVKIPLRERVNFRMIAFAAVMLLVIGYPIYLYVESEVTGGIREGAGGYKQVDLKAMSSFDLDQVYGRIDDIPKRWRELDGQKVELIGEMWAPNAAGFETNYFELVYSISNCCMSGPPQVQHFVNSKPVNGLVPNYHGVLVKVKGTLHVDLKPGDGKIGSVYQLDVESVEPVS